MNQYGLNFADFVVNQVCPNNTFLEEMQSVIPWDVIQEFFDTKIKRNYNRPGRPSYPLMLMFKIHLLQQWYNLSDRQAEFLICDRLSFRKFLELGINDSIPDSTTIENFRHLLWEKNNIGENLISALDKFFQNAGLITKEGNLIDATFLRANSKPHIDPNKNSDADASLGHKGFGYSGTVNVDKKSKLIRKTSVTPANVVDFKSTLSTMVGDERELYGDKGYEPARKILEKKYPKLKLKIMHKRQRANKGYQSTELDVFRSFNNSRYAKERARVEHIFCAIKGVFKFVRLRYRGLERVRAKFESLAIAYNFYRLGFLLRNQVV